MQLKAPFPYFGGKSKIAHEVWKALGEVDYFIEPFCGSCAVLLARPSPFDGSETINDFNCYLINVWRAIANPKHLEELALMLVAPAAEVNTEAQHYALVQKEPYLRNLLGDPEACDIKLAAWWIKGANEWIGSGWCSEGGPWAWTAETGWIKRDGKIKRKLPHLGTEGAGINRQLPHLGTEGKGQYEQRVAWVYGWLSALQDRLCKVRMACGSWERVVSESHLLKFSKVTGVFFDPPYDTTEYVYGGGNAQPVSAQVNAWCKENGGNPRLRIVLAGRGTEHDTLLPLGWSKLNWVARRGYSRAATTGNDTRKDEFLWISPHCLRDAATPNQQGEELF